MNNEPILDQKDLLIIAKALNTNELRILGLKGGIAELMNASEGIRLRQDWQGMIAALAANQIVLNQVLIGMLEE